MLSCHTAPQKEEEQECFSQHVLTPDPSHQQHRNSEVMQYDGSLTRETRTESMIPCTKKTKTKKNQQQNGALAVLTLFIFLLLFLNRAVSERAAGNTEQKVSRALPSHSRKSPPCCCRLVCAEGTPKRTECSSDLNAQLQRDPKTQRAAAVGGSS